MRYRRLTVDGFGWNVIDEGSGPVVLLCHGFPGLAYSWRHQVQPLVSAGYRVIAPDMPGYGGTDSPAAVAEYTYLSAAGRLDALLGSLGVERAIVVGHDFGAPTAWTLALEHPQRVAGLVLLAMPYAPDRIPVRPSEAFAYLARKHFFHFDYFMQPDLADAELDAHPREFLTRIFYALSCDYRYLDIWQHPSRREGVRLGYLDVLPEAPDLPWSWMTSEELDVYHAAFQDSGFTGGLNWYRAADLNWEHQSAQPRVIEQPAHFLCGGNDPVLTIAGHDAVDRMREMMPDLRGVETFSGAGHFIQMERADEVSAALVSFAASLDWA
ncbi:alpha/beta hydrolase [Williamsia sp. 1135]|uniref:alpha/beta fold hydrolase n=1 Tax=Williamsia sp. 1135 TaxID=1889262 RepID=UPI000A1033E4|nr:alpha/beta hydrolase [Williamsia sp. 1135]ORM36568.1 hydrolase [Williamsia sp. 1135]